MTDKILTLETFCNIVKPIAEKYNISEGYLFGSYARGEAMRKSNIDFLVYGGTYFKKTRGFELREELRGVFRKGIDVFEIEEVNIDSNFYQTLMQEKVLIVSNI